jgi:hypothetical protein
MAYSTDYTKLRSHHPLHRDPYDYQVSYTTNDHRNRHRTLDIDRDLPVYPREPHHIPGVGHADASLDHIGDYVARRLVPTMLSRSDLPLQLVMNFGNLHLDSDAQDSGRTATGSNAVIYNAPGSSMSMGARRRSSLDEPGYTAGRKVGICLGCCRRQVVGVMGYCWECEGGGRDPVVASGADRLDGIRYVKTPDWLNARREEREIERERLVELERDSLRDREREWERRYMAHCGDVEREDVHRFRYTRDRW